MNLFKSAILLLLSPPFVAAKTTFKASSIIKHTNCTTLDIKNSVATCKTFNVLAKYVFQSRLQVGVLKLVTQLYGALWFDILALKHYRCPFSSKDQVENKRRHWEYCPSMESRGVLIRKRLISCYFWCDGVKRASHVMVLDGISHYSSHVIYMNPREELFATSYSTCRGGIKAFALATL